MNTKGILLALTYLITVHCFAQQAKSPPIKLSPLPLKLYETMRDSTTALDVVMMQGSGGSLSLEGRNVRLFSSFFENKSALKAAVPLAGSVMWQVNGKELISGNYFLGDSTGYVVFQKDGKEYVNRINNQGNAFLKSQIKK